MSCAGSGRASFLIAGGLLLAGATAPPTASFAAETSLLTGQPMADASNWQPAPINTDTPFFDTDWSVALSGRAIRSSATGDRYQAVLVPSFTLTHTGSVLSYHGTADGQFSRTAGGPINVDSARLSAGSALQFNADTSLATNASLSKSQQDVFAPDVAPDVAATPVTYTGSADATLTQQFGRFKLGSGLSIGRSVFAPTTLTDSSQVDNSGQNNTSGGANLRLGFAITPVVEGFGKVEVTRTVFDAPIPALSTKLDGNQYTVRTGLVGIWGDRLVVSASIGEAYQHFDASGLADVTATLYDASFTYKPVSTLVLNGDFTTTVSPPGPNGSGSAEVSYAASANAVYTVNDWLDYRGSAAWHSGSYTQSSSTDRGYSVGAGADYLLSRHAKLSADYSFSHADVTGSVPTDTQTVSVGFTVQK